MFDALFRSAWRVPNGRLERYAIFLPTHTYSISVHSCRVLISMWKVQELNLFFGSRWRRRHGCEPIKVKDIGEG